MITVNWADDDKSIIQIDYDGSPLQSWDEYRVAVNQSHVLAQQVEHLCYIIHNAGATQMPMDTKTDAIIEMKKSVHDAPANVAVIISVADDGIEKRIVNTLHKVLELPDTMSLYLVATLDEAYTLIKTHQAQSMV